MRSIEVGRPVDCLVMTSTRATRDALHVSRLALKAVGVFCCKFFLTRDTWLRNSPDKSRNQILLMADILSSPPSPKIKKRSAPEHESPEKRPLNLKGNQFMMPTPPDTDNSSNASPEVNTNKDAHDERQREPSPAPSTSTISTLSSTTEDTSGTPATTSNVALASNSATAAGGPPPAKRRKLSPSEKLEKARAKEERDREKAEQKARKDEEKRTKEEEKRVKDQEKREAQQVKDEEKRRKAEEKEAKKREKDLQEERKVQEKLKKERSQMRLGAFFQQKPASSAQANDSRENYVTARRRSLSLELYDDVADEIKAASPAKGTPPPATEKKALTSDNTSSDYSRTFLPFVLQTHSRLAPAPAACESAQTTFDQEIQDPSLQEQYNLGVFASYKRHADINHYFTHEREAVRGVQCPNMRELVDTIHGTSRQPIDLTSDSNADTAMDRLRKVPVKHIQFEQDVRPAYCGTWTKLRSPSKIKKVRIKPFTRARPDTDYDYDSEAEWEEPEEGDEEVLSEDDDEADSQADADDIDGFLDDEEDAGKNKRKIITGELVPDSTGLCWANHKGRVTVVESIEVSDSPQQLKGMAMGTLLPGFSGSTIDPFSSTYWDDSVSTMQAPESSANDGPIRPMAPPRVPLQPRPNTTTAPRFDLLGAAEGQKGPITSVYATQAAKRGPKPAPKTLSQEDLAKFKEAVIGSPIGKLELQKGLKAR